MTPAPAGYQRPTLVEKGQVWNWLAQPWVIFAVDGPYIRWNPLVEGMDEWHGCGWTVKAILEEKRNFEFHGWFDGYGPELVEAERRWCTNNMFDPITAVTWVKCNAWGCIHARSIMTFDGSPPNQLTAVAEAMEVLVDPVKRTEQLPADSSYYKLDPEWRTLVTKGQLQDVLKECPALLEAPLPSYYPKASS